MEGVVIKFIIMGTYTMCKRIAKVFIPFLRKYVDNHDLFYSNSHYALVYTVAAIYAH